MQPLIKSLLFTILLFQISLVDAQETSKEILVEIDTITHSAKTSAPFHAPFVLKVPVAEFPEEIWIYSSRKQNNLGDMIIEEELRNEKKSIVLTPVLIEALSEYRKTVQTQFDSIVRRFYENKDINAVTNKTALNNATQLFLDAIDESSKDIKKNKLKRKTRAFNRKLLRFVDYSKNNQKTKPRKQYHFFKYQSKLQNKINTHLHFSSSKKIQSYLIEKIKTEKEQYLLIHFNDIEYSGNLAENLYLDPELFYSFDFVYKDKRALQIIDLQHSLYSVGDANVQEKFNNKLEELNKEPENEPITANSSLKCYLPVQSNYYKIDSIVNLLATCTIENPFTLNFNTCCEDNTILKSQLFLTSKINGFDQTKWNAIFGGLETTSSLKSNEKYDIDNRLKAISTSKTEFTELYKNILYYSNSSLDSDTNDQLTCILQTLEMNEQLLKKAQKEKNEITEMVTSSLPYKNNNLSNPNTSAKLSTNSFTLDTRINRKLVADFGLGYYANIFNGESRRQFQGFTPYLGLSYSFAPLNKDIPFNKYPKYHKKFLRRFTLNLGYTTQKIATDENALDMFDKGSLVFSVGFRWTHVIKINPGIVIFYKDDNNPLTTRKTFTTTPYVGLSVDISLKTLFNGFSELQTSKFI